MGQSANITFMSDKQKAWAAILLAAGIGGGTATFTKLGLKEMSPISFISLRFIAASLALIPFVWRQLPRKTNDWLVLLGVSLFSTANITLYTYGIRLTGATIGQIFYSFVPVMVAVLSYFLLREKLTIKKVLGVAIALVGTSLIAILPNFKGSELLKGNFMGNLMILAGAVMVSFYPVLSKRVQHKYSPLVLTSVFVLVTAVIHMILSLIETRGDLSWMSGLSIEAWGSVAYVGLLSTAIYYLFYQFGIKYGSALIGSLMLYIQPVAVFIWAYITLGERLTQPFVAGSLLILYGAYLVNNNNK
jgi:drug/metabolite transporter (DMT)-like permease